MTITWRLFVPAALLTGYLLITRGVPVLPVLGGCLLAFLFAALKVRPLSPARETSRSRR
jgi:hypothetical protein